MKAPGATVLLILLLPALAACQSTSPRVPPQTHAVEAVAKVVDSLAGEAERRGRSDGYRGLPMVVRVSNRGGSPLELIVAEFLRTRLLERGATVHRRCEARCLEIALQEFATSAPGPSELTPGQILTVATGSVPVLGNIARSLSEREREAERAAARSTGLLVTFAAREGERYTARSHAVAIVSTSSGDVELEPR